MSNIGEDFVRRTVRQLTWLAVLAGILSSPMLALADDDPEITEDFLQAAENIQLGRELFKKHCDTCHGKSSYPGKAPKLKPHKISAEDVYLRITYGWRKMPPWEDVYSNHERMALTAYIKSPIFSN